MSGRKLIADRWQSFEAEVVPASAGPTQREEMRYAFYAGAEAMFVLMLEHLSGGDGDPTTEDSQVISVLDDLDAELRGFVAELAETGREGRERS